MIANFRITEINGKRGEGAGAGKIETVFNVMDTEKKKDAALGDYVRLRFGFDIKYPGDMGEIKFKGNLWYCHPELDKQVTEEEDMIELSANAVIEISNMILSSCLIEGMGIASKLNLPGPIKLPQVKSANPIKYKKIKNQ